MRTRVVVLAVTAVVALGAGACSDDDAARPAATADQTAPANPGVPEVPAPAPATTTTTTTPAASGSPDDHPSPAEPPATIGSRTRHTSPPLVPIPSAPWPRLPDRTHT